VKIPLDDAEFLKDFSIQIDTAKVGKNDSIESLLKSRSITPNKTARGIVLDLNPKMDKTRPKIGETIHLPKLQIRKGALGLSVTLTSEKREIQTGIDGLHSSLVGLLESNSTLEDAQKLAFTREVAGLVTELSAFDDEKLFVSPAIAKSATMQAARLSQYLDQRMKLGELTNADLDVVKSIRSNLSIAMDEIKSGSRGSKQVSANTIFQTNPSSGYRVYVIADGFYEVFKDDLEQLIKFSDPYQKLNTPTDAKEIMSGDYRFWAKRGETVSEFQLLKIRYSSSDSVDVTVPAL